jgi:hypothetical protein
MPDFEITHKGTAPPGLLDESRQFQHVIGVFDGTMGYAAFPGEVPHGWQLIARRHDPRGNMLGNLIHDLLVNWRLA